METRSKTSQKSVINKRKSIKEYETNSMALTNSKKKRINSRESKKQSPKRLKNLATLMENNSESSNEVEIVGSAETNIIINSNSNMDSNSPYNTRSKCRKKKNEKNEIFIAIDQEGDSEDYSKEVFVNQKTPTRGILIKSGLKTIKKPKKVIIDEQESEIEFEQEALKYEKDNKNNEGLDNINTDFLQRSEEPVDKNPFEIEINYKSKLRSKTSQIINASDKKDVSVDVCSYLPTERKMRSSSTKMLNIIENANESKIQDSKYASKTNSKLTDDKNKYDTISKQKVKENYRSVDNLNNQNKTEMNSVSNFTSEETVIYLSENNNLVNETKSKSKQKKKSKSNNKSKSKSKTASKASSSLNLPLNSQGDEHYENNLAINNENLNSNNNFYNANTSKNASTTNLFSFDLQKGYCGEAPEKEDLSSDITDKISNSLIYCREAEKQRVLEFINNKDLKTLFICGQPGTGKTSLLLEIFKKDLRAVKTAIKLYINCMSVHSAEDFYYQILKFLLFENFNLLDNQKDLNILLSYREVLNSKKNLNKTLLEILELYKSKFTFLILLDEVDNFYQKQKEIVFYEILNTPYLTDTVMKLMLISNNSEFDKDVMPKIESRKIKVSRIVFKPYTHNEIYDILRKKLNDAGILEVFQDEALKLISKKLANKMGDLRPAIEIVKNLILENKAKILQIENNNINNNNNCKNNENNFNSNLNFDATSKTNDTDYNLKLNGFINSEDKETKAKPLITLRDVLIKLKQKNQNFVELMNNLTIEQKIVLLSFYIIYDRSKNSEMDEKVILNTYKMIKRDNFNSEYNIMDYKEIIKTFCDMAIIECKNKAKGKFKIKYDLDDLELIFVDDKIFKMFKGN